LISRLIPVLLPVLFEWSEMRRENPKEFAPFFRGRRAGETPAPFPDQ
jgi:hypothetical protein